MNSSAKMVFCLFGLGLSQGAWAGVEDYVGAFGHGRIAAMQVADGDAYPMLNAFTPGDYRYEDGVFRIDAGAEFSFRLMFKDGKTAGQLLADAGGNYQRYLVSYWSDAQREAHGRSLPSDPLEVPDWEPIFSSFTKLDEVFLGWRSAGFSWNDDVTPKIRDWVSESSKPGDSLRIVIRFQGAAPHEQGRYWNKNTGMWVTPTLITNSPAFAGGTIVFE